MYETITIVSAIISVATLIVFFVMAYNISALVKETKILKQAIFSFMNNKGVTVTVCSDCQKPYYSMNDEREYCPHCGYLNINKKSK